MTPARIRLRRHGRLRTADSRRLFLPDKLLSAQGLGTAGVTGLRPRRGLRAAGCPWLRLPLGTLVQVAAEVSGEVLAAHLLGSLRRGPPVTCDGSRTWI